MCALVAPARCSAPAAKGRLYGLGNAALTLRANPVQFLHLGSEICILIKSLLAHSRLPAQHLAKRFRRHAVRIEEVQAIEMVGDRAVIGFHAGDPEGGHADHPAGPGKQSEQTAAGDWHDRLQGWSER